MPSLRRLIATAARIPGLSRPGILLRIVDGMSEWYGTYQIRSNVPGAISRLIDTARLSLGQYVVAIRSPLGSLRWCDSQTINGRSWTRIQWS
jgi:hypothetical protein